MKKNKLWVYVLPVVAFCLVLTLNSSYFTGYRDSYQSLASDSDQTIDSHNNLQAVPQMSPTVMEQNAQKQSQDEGRQLDVPLVYQMPELPRGCEVTSLTMLLQFAGVNVGKMELASNMPKIPFMDDDLHGDMNEGFVGDMYSFDNPGLGVYSDAVFKLGSSYLPNQLVNVTGKDMKDLYTMIDHGSPVWVITNGSYAELPESSFQTWDTANGPVKVTYREHSVVMTGYDKDYIYINDPLGNASKVRKYDFEQAWIQMGRQAIGLTPQLVAEAK
ncbi:C39 family peptidase [Paenibacillus sp. KN14-4R]|uniref:C39 family peptidase n=1 Tax=Paenibacillus sp. KN14-4R TaxID=3445773 RepID=UPI003F9F7191